MARGALIDGAWRVVAAGATGVAGVLALTSTATPNVPARDRALRAFEPDVVVTLGHVLTGFGGFALLALAWGMLRGRRRAAELATLGLIALAVLHAVKGLDYEESAVALALAGLLRANRRAFARGGGASRPSLLAGTVAVGALTAAYVSETLALMLTGRSPSLLAAAAAAGRALVSGGWWLRSDAPLAVTLDALAVVALLGAGLFLLAVLRPARAPDGHTVEDHARAATVVAVHARDSLAPFVLREDKAFFFARGGLVAYRTLRETAVVSGDPVGPPEERRAILADFLGFAGRHGWDVVVTGASEHALADARALGLHVLHIGNEAVVAPRGFSLEGRAIRKVRQSVHRVARQGWRVEVLEGWVLGARTAEELAAVEAAWCASRPRLTGFAMTLGHLGRGRGDGDDLYALARSPAGELRAFLRFVAYPGGLSLDVMRRLDDEPNGLNEALVVAALEHARDRGIAEVSLNFAGFAHVMAADAALSRGQRALRVLFTRAHGRFQLERLVRFNEKFAPRWRPRFLLYGGATRLPLAALRVLQAEAYLGAPRRRPLRRGWRPPADAARTLPDPAR